LVIRKESTWKKQKYGVKPDLGINCVIDFHTLKNQVSATDYIEEWVENWCDGGLLIAENFYLRKDELDQQSLNYVARNKCLLKIRDRDTLIEQSLL